MGRAAFVRQCRSLTADTFLRATTQEGAGVGPPSPDVGNDGQLSLRGSGVPLSAAVLDLALQTGGNVTGYFAESTGGSAGTPGATARWREDGDGDEEWRGYIDTPWFVWGQIAGLASATTDYPGTSPVKTLGNGKGGFCRVSRPSVGSASIEFLYKTARRDAWTTVALTIVGTSAQPDSGSAPDFVMLSGGRLILYYLTVGYVVRAFKSDDHGATWAAWSSRTHVGPLDAASRQLSAVAVDDHVCLIASMAAAGTTVDAYVGWSSDGGQTFTIAATEEWGPARACATAAGSVLAVATDQTAAVVYVYPILPGGGPGAGVDTGDSTHATGVSPAIALRDDGVLWVFSGTGGAGGSGSTSPAVNLNAVASIDNGATWQEAGPGYVWGTGVDPATPYGFRGLSAGEWQGRILVLGVTNVATAARDDMLIELHYGGWDHITESASETNAAYVGYGIFYGGRGSTTPLGCYIPMDLPDNMGWTATNVAAGATVTIDAEGLDIVSTAANNTYYTADTTYYITTGVADSRMKFGFFVTSGGSIADNRSTVQLGLSDGSGNRQLLICRMSTDQIRMVDGAGTTLGTSVLTLNQFTTSTEVYVVLKTETSATTGTVSAWYRTHNSEFWVNFVDNASVSEQVAATARCRIGGSDAGASEWTLVYGPALCGDLGEDLHYSGVDNPADLAGRPVPAVSDMVVTEGFRLGGAGGAGIRGDLWTWATSYSYSGAWLVRSARPSAQWRATEDGTATEVVFDAGATDSFIGDTFGLVGWNVRAATVQLNATDSWGSPSVSSSVSMVVWQGVIGSAKGPGYFTVDGSPWTPHRFQSLLGRRWFLEVGGVVYEITDNDRNTMEIDGVDFTAISGTAYVFGDRGAALLSQPARYRFLRVLISSLPTVDDAYIGGSLFVGTRHELTVPWALGYVREQASPAQVYTTEIGYRSASARGPWAESWRLAWDPIDEPSSGALSGLMAFFRALRGEFEPFMFIPDVDALTELDVVRAFGPVAAENVYGNRNDQLARLAQIILRTEP